eukprot:m.56075 g.56075  ORF g.56075 m.56075 type:complete len:74 (-) comp9290_c0_seq1:1574-1795(-)
MPKAQLTSLIFVGCHKPGSRSRDPPSTLSRTLGATSFNLLPAVLAHKAIRALTNVSSLSYDARSSGLGRDNSE